MMIRTIEKRDGIHRVEVPDGFFNHVAALVHEHRVRLIAYAKKHGVDSEEALDCVQDAFHQFLQMPQAHSLRSCDESMKLLTVILRHIVWNRRARYSRRRRAISLVAQESTPAAESSEDLLARAQAIASMKGCILDMERMQRAVIELSLIDELPGESIAESLGISHGYVRVLMHRARAKFRTCGADSHPQAVDRVEPLA